MKISTYPNQYYMYFQTYNDELSSVFINDQEFQYQQFSDSPRIYRTNSINFQRFKQYQITFNKDTQYDL